MSAPSPARHSAEDKLVDALIGLMEAGTTPWRRPWSEDGGGHHVNLLSGRRYRGSNPILLSLGLHLRGSSLPYWCGFAEAKARGLSPRKGSQAVHVLRPQGIGGDSGGQDSRETSGTAAGTTAAPARAGEQGEAAASAGGHGDTREETVSPALRRRMLFRPIPVFNAADLEGEALADLIALRRDAAAATRRPEPERLQAAEAALTRWPVAVLHGGDKAYYIPAADRIQLPDRAAFHSAAALYATWAHEAIHSTGHPSRLGRDLSGVMGAGEARGRTYAREELVAELGAVLLGDRLEIGSDTQNHAAYLSHWIALLRETPRLLLQVLSDARRAADLIAPEVADPTPPGEGSACAA